MNCFFHHNACDDYLPLSDCSGPSSRRTPDLPNGLGTDARHEKVGPLSHQTILKIYISQYVKFSTSTILRFYIFCKRKSIGVIFFWLMESCCRKSRAELTGFSERYVSCKPIDRVICRSISLSCIPKSIPFFYFLILDTSDTALCGTGTAVPCIFFRIARTITWFPCLQLAFSLHFLS